MIVASEDGRMGGGEEVRKWSKLGKWMAFKRRGVTKGCKNRSEEGETPIHFFDITRRMRKTVVQTHSRQDLKIQFNASHTVPIL